MRAIGVVILTCCMLGSANAAERNPLDATFIFDAGTFLLSTDTRVRLDGTATVAGRGTDINFDRTFGIGDADRFRAEAFWRFFPRHGLRAVYFDNDRQGTRTLDRDISFGDFTFPVNVSASAQSNATTVQLSYEYAFLRRERYEVAASLGIYYLDLEFKVSGQSGAALVQQNASTNAPLPLIGVRALWRLSDQFYVGAQAQYFYVDVDPYSGSLLDLKASLVWQFTDYVGLGVAYDDFRFQFNLDEEKDFEGRLRWDYGGLMVFATFMF